MIFIFDDFSLFLMSLIFSLVLLVFIFDPNILYSLLSSFMFLLTPDVVYRAIAVVSSLILTSVTVHLFSKVLGGR